MDDTKKNDWLSYVLANDDFSVDDFRNNGINSSNTSLADAKVYEKNPEVQNMPAFQTNGQFDKSKFEQFYNSASARYNNLADAQYHDDIIKYSMYHRDNIYVPKANRREGPDTYIEFARNPYQQVKSLYEMGITEDPTKTDMEIAETRPMLDLASNTFKESPNESSWFDFFTPKVMAQWDSDGTSIDPLTGEIVKHAKGELKTDSLGYFYSESLNGRDPSGRRIISKMDTLTVDGSTLNQYDFFDSDDVDKSVTGSIAKAAVPLILMSIPYVNTAYFIYQISKEALSLGTTAAKCFVGESNPFINNLGAFTKSLDPGITQNSMQHPWSVENILTMASDTVQMLWTQRFVFEKAPKLFGMQDLNVRGNIDSKNPFSKSLAIRTGKMQQEFLDTQYKKYATELGDRVAKAGGEFADMDIKNIATIKARADLNNIINDYNKLGEKFSHAYMSLLPIAGIYDTLKQEGAGDVEASMITLGVAAGNEWMMRLPIGSWMLPEMRLERTQMETAISKMYKEDLPNFKAALDEDMVSKEIQKGAANAAKKKAEDVGENIAKKGEEVGEKVETPKKPESGESSIDKAPDTSTSTQSMQTKEAKTNYMQRWFNWGKKKAEAQGKKITEKWDELYNPGKTTAKALLAGSLNASAMGVGFEVLIDLNKSIDNAIKWLSGDDSKRLPVFNNIGERYAKAILGGFIGGGIAQFSSSYRAAKEWDPSKVDNQKAMEMVCALIRNGKRKEIDKVINENTWGNKDLSTETYIDNEGQTHFKAGTDKDNQDIAIKLAIKKQLDQYEDNLVMTGTDISDFQLIDKMSFKDLRYASAYQSLSAKGLLKTFNNIVVQESQARKALYEAQHESVPEKMAEGKTDASSKGPDIYQDSKIKFLESKVKFYEKARQDFLSEDNSKNFTANLIFEQKLGDKLAIHSFDDYALLSSGAKRIEDIPDNELVDIKAKYDVYKNGIASDKIYTSAEMYKEVAAKMTPFIQKVVDALQDPEIADLYTRARDVDEQMFRLSLKEEGVDQTASYRAQEESKIDIEQNIRAFYELIGIEPKEELLDIDQFLEVLKNNSVKNRVEKLSKVPLPISIQYFLNRISTIVYDSIEDKKTSGLDISEYANIKVPLIIESGEIKKEEPYIKFYMRKGIDSLGMDLLENVSINLADKKVSVKEVFKELAEQCMLKRNSLGEFFIPNDTLVSLRGISDLIDTVKSFVEGAIIKPVGDRTLYNLNNSLNSIFGENKYAEITPEMGEVLIGDLESIKNTFKYYTDLDALNQSSNIKEQNKSAVTVQALLFNKVSSVIKHLPTTWKGVEEIQGVLSELTLLPELSTKFNADDTDNLNFLDYIPELNKIDDAWYDFIHENGDKDISEIISPENFDLLSTTYESSSSKSKTLKSHSYITYLAARAALRSSDFYYMLQNSSEDDIAMLYSQLIPVYNNIAYKVNNGMMSRFGNAINTSIKRIATEDKYKYIRDKHPEIMFETPLDTPYSFTFDIPFCEGNPGSGKTKAVAVITDRIFRKYFPDVVKNRAVLSITKKAANEFSEALGDVKNSKSFTKDEFFSTISQDWKNLVNKATGEIDISETDFQRSTKTEPVKSKWTLKEPESIPSIVYIDEGTSLSTLDYELLNRFHLKYKVPILVFGDNLQNKAVGSIQLHKLDSDGNETDHTFTYRAEIDVDNFYSNPKIDVSVRAKNKQSVTNAELTRKDLIQVLTEYAIPDNVRMYSYHQLEDSLVGTKVIKANNNPQIKKDIDFIFDHTKDKVGVIVKDESSPVLSFLKNNPKYEGKYDVYFGKDAQSHEASYFIIEDYYHAGSMDPKDAVPQYIDSQRALHTAITRSKIGNILITTNANIQSTEDVGEKPIILSESDLTTSISKLNETIDNMLRGYSFKTPEIVLKTHIEDNKNSDNSGEESGATFNPKQNTSPSSSKRKDTSTTNGDKSNNPPNLPNNANDGLDKSKDKNGKVSGNKGKAKPNKTHTPKAQPKKGEQKVIVDGLERNNDSDNSELEDISNPLAGEKDILRTAKLNEDKVADDIEDIANGVFGYTDSTGETGWVLDPETGRYNPPRFDTYRTDSFNGLTRLIPNFKDLDPKKQLNILFSIRGAIQFAPDEATLLSEVQRILNENGSDVGELVGTIGYRKYNGDPKSTIETEKNKANFGRRMFKDENTEVVYNPQATSKDALKIPRSAIYYMIGEKATGLDTLDIPLIQLPNANTYLKILVAKGSTFARDLYEGWRKYATEHKVDWSELSKRNIASKLGGSYIGELLEQQSKLSPEESGYLKRDSSEYKILNNLRSIIGLYTLAGHTTVYLRKYAGKAPSEIWTNLGIVTNTATRGADYLSDVNLLTVEGKPTNLYEIANDARFTISDIHQATQEIPLSGKDGTVKKKILVKPCILVSDCGIPKENLESEYKRQTDDPTLPQRVKLYYVDSPTGNISDYVDELINVFGKRFDRLTRIGNMSTSYRILRAVFGVRTNTINRFEKEFSKWDDLAQIDVSVSNEIFKKASIYNILKKAYPESLTSESAARDVIRGMNALVKVFKAGGYNEDGSPRERENLTAIAKAMVANENENRNILQRLLFHMTTKEEKTAGIEDTIYTKNNDAIDYIQSVLDTTSTEKGGVINKIYYYPKYKKGKKRFATLDVQNYKMDNKPFIMMAKPETGMYKNIDINYIYDTVMNSGEHKFTRDGYIYIKASEKTSDLNRYYHYLLLGDKVPRESRPITKVEEKVIKVVPILDTYIDPDYTSVRMSPETSNALKVLTSGMSDAEKASLDKKAINSLLISNGHLVLTLNDTTFVFNRDDLLKNAKVETPIYDNRKRIYNIKATLEDGTEVVGTIKKGDSSMILSNTNGETNEEVKVEIPNESFFSVNAELDPRLVEILQSNQIGSSSKAILRAINKYKASQNGKTLSQLYDYCVQAEDNNTVKAITDLYNNFSTEHPDLLSEFFGDKKLGEKAEEKMKAKCLTIEIKL